MNHYYQDSAVTIYNGDCRQILPALGEFDLLLTDPPYGIGADNQKQILSRSKKAKAKDYGKQNWDSSTVEDWLLLLALSKAINQIIFGGNYYNLPPSQCWLVWDKQNGENDFADCEMAWTNYRKSIRLKSHLWNGMIRKNNEERFHPTQKPLEIMTWALTFAGEDAKTIIDPFAGSGTTGRAAKDLGRQAVLIEREEKYCEIAAKRMAQEVLPL